MARRTRQLHDADMAHPLRRHPDVGNTSEEPTNREPGPAEPLTFRRSRFRHGVHLDMTPSASATSPAVDTTERASSEPTS